jgi:catalase-peroxidase
LEDVQKAFNGSLRRQEGVAGRRDRPGRLGGHRAGREAGRLHDVEVPFAPGRTDATQAQTDAASFAVLEPTADGFRNYFGKYTRLITGTEMLVERANLLTSDRARNDRAGRRHARPECANTGSHRMACSPIVPAR